MSESRRCGPSAGFTLIEVVVALAVSVVVVLLAHRMSVLAADSAVQVGDSSFEADREANAALLLGSLVAQAEVGAGGATRFLGHSRTATFTTWCEMPAGWQESCRIALGFVQSPERRLVAILPTGRVIVLHEGFRSGAFRYLTDAADGGTWIPTWADRTGPPLAVGVILDGDTLIMPIGPRG